MANNAMLNRINLFIIAVVLSLNYYFRWRGVSLRGPGVQKGSTRLRWRQSRWLRHRARNAEDLFGGVTVEQDDDEDEEDERNGSGDKDRGGET